MYRNNQKPTVNRENIMNQKPNAETINNLSLRLQELQVARASVVGSAGDLIDAEIKKVKQELHDLNPAPSLAAAIVAKVDDIDIASIDITRYDDLLPIIAVKAINGSAKAMISHLRYVNNEYERIMGRQANRVASTSTWKFNNTPKGTGPYEEDEDRVLRFQEEAKGCITELAVLKANWEKAADRYMSQTGRELLDFDMFPDVGQTLRFYESLAAENAARRKARETVSSSLSPNVVAML
jgi:hypothetical protein